MKRGAKQPPAVLARAKQAAASTEYVIRSCVDKVDQLALDLEQHLSRKLKGSHFMKTIPITDLHPHPGNPRLSPRDDVINQIAAQLNGRFDEAHALIVRPNGDGYQIISGHHRYLAAKKAGLSELPCWVREMTDDDAYMALALHNAQSELHPLEVGLHALRSGLSVREYAGRTGASATAIAYHRQGAEVFTYVNGSSVTRDKARHLAEIHAAPPWLWRALVTKMIDEGWTVERTRD